MAIKKKTMEQIAKENNIDLSDSNAQKVADAYIQPTLEAITNAEQNAAASAQSARKSLESDYFQKYRDSMYEAQSRGLTGGLANIAENRLRMQMADKNTAISNALLQKEAELQGERGTALSNAQAYKESYLKDLRDTVMKLRADDYAERVAMWKAQEELSIQRAQLAASQKANELQENAQKIQNKAYANEYATAQLSGIYNTYARMIQQGNVSGANSYLNQQINMLAELGYDTSSIRSEFNELETIRQYQSFIDEYSDNYTAASVGNIGINALPLIGPIISMYNSLNPNSNYRQLKSMLNTAKSNRSNAVLPSWYTGTTQNWYSNYLKAMGLTK